jgi:molybdenum cofactor cytidylyltransferase
MIGLAILAAGASTRFGSPKQLARVGGQSLLARAAAMATQFDGRAVIVLGANAEALRGEVEGVEVVVNQRWAEGMSTSIHAAIHALGACEAVILALADQPAVTIGDLEALVAAYRTSHAAVVAAEYADTVGAPALFDRSRFDALLALRGDAGARALLRQGDVVRVPIPNAAWDVDRLSDLR